MGPRPIYDLARTAQEQRIASKVEELADTSLVRSRNALFTFRKAYQSEGTYYGAGPIRDVVSFDAQPSPVRGARYFVPRPPLGLVPLALI